MNTDSDVVSIELVLDSETEARVRADWAALAAAGMSSLGAYRSETNRPHMTLLVRSALASVDFSGAVTQLPVAVNLVEPVVFAHGDRGVLAWKIEPSEELMNLHRAVHAAVPAGTDAAHTAPGDWTPHLTLARRLRLATLADALALLGPAHVGTGVSLRRWDAASATVTPLS